MNKPFFTGLKDGIPIGLGYLSVSFGFGILAASSGLSPFEAFVVSAANMTSAGQVAGVEIMAAGGSLVEMALTQLIINIRYALMALSLSQKLDVRFGTLHRLIGSATITDEIFGVAHSKEGKILPAYLYGVFLVAFLGWTGGTLAGALAGDILPKALTDSLGIMLYGMFLAIFLPEAKKSRGVLVVIAAAGLISILFRYVFTAVSGGFAIIISAVLAAALGAVAFPVEEEAA